MFMGKMQKNFGVNFKKFSLNQFYSGDRNLNTFFIRDQRFVCLIRLKFHQHISLFYFINPDLNYPEKFFKKKHLKIKRVLLKLS